MIKKEIYFMMYDALETKSKILSGKRGPQNLYGAVELEKESKAKIINSNFKNVFKLKRGSIVIVNRSKYIFLLKLFGKKVVLININSNHSLSQNKKTLKNFISYFYYIATYRLCDLIVCISNIQIDFLKKIGVKNLVVIPIGVGKNVIKKIRLSKKYYLSIGGDPGRNQDFVRKALRGFNVKIVDGTSLNYKGYLKLIAGCNALILHIDTTRKGSSDLSGTTTSYEALLMKKPIFINYQPWLKELFKDNYHVYKNEDDLRRLLRKNIKFREFKDKSHLTLENFSSKLLKNIKSMVDIH